MNIEVYNEFVTNDKPTSSHGVEKLKHKDCICH